MGHFSNAMPKRILELNIGQKPQSLILTRTGKFKIKKAFGPLRVQLPEHCKNYSSANSRRSTSKFDVVRMSTGVRVRKFGYCIAPFRCSRYLCHSTCITR